MNINKITIRIADKAIFNTHPMKIRNHSFEDRFRAFRFTSRSQYGIRKNAEAMITRGNHNPSPPGYFFMSNHIESTVIPAITKGNDTSSANSF